MGTGELNAGGIGTCRLSLDIVPSSSSAITPRCVNVFVKNLFKCVPFRFVSKQRKTSNAVEISYLIYFDYKQGSFGSR